MKTNLSSRNLLLAMVLLAMVIFMASGCKKEPEKPADDQPGAIQGNPGNPRFNLQFTNGTKTDLDLHVLTPDGSEIYYGIPQGQGGQLDVDCLCGICPNGPNENIYWTEGTAPHGTYKFWVEYYGDCEGTGASSDYTLRVMKNSQVLNTYNGTLTPSVTRSSIYSFTY
jgi:hypothetical protein